MRLWLPISWLFLTAAAAAQEPSPAPDLSVRLLEERLAELERAHRALEEKLAAQQATLAAQQAKAAELTRQFRPAEQSTGVPIVSFGPNGMVLRTPDGKTTIQTRGLVQADGRAFLGDSKHLLTDTFLLRRVRPSIEATFFGWLQARIMPDFGQNKAYVVDAFVDATPWRWLGLIGGKFKPPVGLERLETEAATKFIERAFPTALVPSRDVGAALHGSVRGGALEYQIGVFNGVIDGAETPDTDLHDGKELAARVFAHPLRTLGNRWLNNLGLGIAGTYGNERGNAAAPNVSSYKSPGQNTFFTFFADTTKVDGYVYANGQRWRVSPQLYYYGGPFGLMAEYVRSTQALARATFKGNGTAQAWQIQLSLLLTPGDQNGFDGVQIKRPLEHKNHGYGAFEVVARYHGLRVDDDVFTNFADKTKSAGQARAFGVGLNWYANTFFRAAINYDRTDYKGGATTGNRAPENALMGRLQVVF